MGPLGDRLAMLAAAAPGRVSCSVWDPAEEEPLELDAHRAVYPASIIKIPIMVAVFAAARQGTLDLEASLPVERADQVGGTGILKDLLPRPTPVWDLITLMITLSDNTATNVLLKRLGLPFVNETLAELGLRETQVRGPLQVVPFPPRSGNVTTAHDTTRLLVRMARGEAVSLWASERMVDILKRQQDTSRIPALLPRKGEATLGMPLWQVANKTGTVPGICHDAGLLLLPGRTIALSFLLEGVEDTESGARAIATMARAVYDHYTDFAGVD